MSLESNSHGESQAVLTNSTATASDEQRYRRWWESKDEQSEPGSFFEMMYEDVELANDQDDPGYVLEQQHWTPQYQIDERYAKNRQLV